MTTINPVRTGFATALTVSLLYLACILVIMIMPKETAVAFYNSVLHGIDISTILMSSMSLPQLVFGLINMFIIGWLVGATFAAVYNLLGNYMQGEEGG